MPSYSFHRAVRTTAVRGRRRPRRGRRRHRKRRECGDVRRTPLEFEDISERIRFGLEGALEQGVIEDGDELACATSVFGDGIDTVSRVRADVENHTGIYDIFAKSRADPRSGQGGPRAAIELGQKGQKGKPVGALFIVGDAGKVMNKSRPLSYNPFEKSHVHVGDPIVNVMLKEFSRLDGAFIISDAGKIVSAYRYPRAVGRGGRHSERTGRTAHGPAAARSRRTPTRSRSCCPKAMGLSGRSRAVNSFWRSIRRRTDMVDWQPFVNEPAVIAAAVLALGLVVGYLVGRLNEELLSASASRKPSKEHRSSGRPSRSGPRRSRSSPG